MFHLAAVGGDALSACAATPGKEVIGEVSIIVDEEGLSLAQNVEARMCSKTEARDSIMEE